MTLSTLSSGETYNATYICVCMTLSSGETYNATYICVCVTLSGGLLGYAVVSVLTPGKGCWPSSHNHDIG